MFRVAHVTSFADYPNRVLNTQLIRCARERGWRLKTFSLQQDAAPIETLKKWNPHGVIFDLINRQQEKAIAELKCPIVKHYGCDEDFAKLKFAAWIKTDETLVAETAAEYLTKKNCKSFAYAHPITVHKWSLERVAAFKTVLAVRGRTICSEFYGRNTWYRDDERLIKWLHKLPRPCAILAANDYRAESIANVCNTHGIKIPEEIILLGVDNDSTVCETTIPSLSSIDIHTFPTTDRLAELLTQLMNGKQLESNVGYGISYSIIERLSTQDLGGAKRIVAQAREYIRTHSEDCLTVKKVADALNVSPSLLNLRFNEVLHRTVKSEIADTALARATEILSTTRQPISFVAAACGYKNEFHFKTLFKRRYALTMSDYRAHYSIF